ncbi:MAG: GAF domain-containing protein [Candidatus Rokubacteria bacterium]|nr:GAF domain-containing protein [Candidatus Rokubacteria bacterium]
MSLNVILVLISILNVLIGWYVLQKNPTKAPNRTFAWVATAGGLWVLGVFFAHNEPWAYTTFARLPFAAGSLVAFGVLVLSKVFPPRSELQWEWDIVLFGILCGFFTFVSFTPLVARSVALIPGGIQWTYGPLYHLFALYFWTCFGHGFLTLIWHYRHSVGLMKLQLRYLVLGLLIPIMLGAITNLLIPLIFGTSQFTKYGPLVGILSLTMIGHAIIRHRLMDIRVVVKKGVVYIAAFVAAGGILTGLIVSSNVLFPEDQLGMARDIVLGLVVALLFAPLKGQIQRTFDRYLYRSTYDYQRTFREATRRMATMLELRSLLPYACDVTSRTFQPEIVEIFVRDSDRGEYRLAAMRGGVDIKGPRDLPPISETAGLPALLRAERAPMLRDDLIHGVARPDTVLALDDLHRLGGEVAVPILHENELTGFLVVGPKRSGDPYFAEDLDLLSTLAGHAAIAIKNAQLYHQVVLVNEYVENILKTMESGVVAVNVEGHVTLFNPAAERLTGLDATRVRSGLVGQLPAALSAAIGATLADGQPRLHVETTLSGSTGGAAPVVYSTSPFHDSYGRLLGAVLVFSDLTHLKELEREKQRAERLASFGALASGIAHEIKNPLVAIKTFAQLLPKKFTNEDFREDFAKVAVREIGRIEGLLERLRDLSKPPEDQLQPLDLREPIEATLQLLQGQLEEARTVVHRQYPVDVCPVAGNPEKLEELFLNLFLNALQAMGPDGELTIRLDKHEEPGRAAALRLQVSDTGPGIPEALLGKVFDPFFTTKPGGSGLGLAICRAIADVHRATIRAENGPGGRGAILTLEFPVAVEVPEELKA